MLLKATASTMAAACGHLTCIELLTPGSQRLWHIADFLEDIQADESTLEQPTMLNRCMLHPHLSGGLVPGACSSERCLAESG